MENEELQTFTMANEELLLYLLTLVDVIETWFVQAHCLFSDYKVIHVLQHHVKYVRLLCIFSV